MFKTLRVGDIGSQVLEMQKCLCKHGFELKKDGQFGPVTEARLMDFQLAFGLVSDGICGNATWGSLLTKGAMRRGSVDALGEYRDELEKEWEGIRGRVRGKRLCRVALQDLNKQEIPYGSNKGVEIAHIVQCTQITGVEDTKESEYKRYWGIPNGKKFGPWCAKAVSAWMAIESDASEWEDIVFGRWFGGVTQTRKWAEKEGVWREEIGYCFPGELFVMGRRGSGSDSTRSATAGHIGIILFDEGDSVRTVEGNASNGVRSRSRKKVDLWGIVDWESLV